MSANGTSTPAALAPLSLRRALISCVIRSCSARFSSRTVCSCVSSSVTRRTAADEVSPPPLIWPTGPATRLCASSRCSSLMYFSFSSSCARISTVSASAVESPVVVLGGLPLFPCDGEVDPAGTGSAVVLMLSCFWYLRASRWVSSSLRSRSLTFLLCATRISSIWRFSSLMRLAWFCAACGCKNTFPAMLPAVLLLLLLLPVVVVPGLADNRDLIAARGSLAGGFDPPAGLFVDGRRNSSWADRASNVDDLDDAEWPAVPLPVPAPAPVPALLPLPEGARKSSILSVKTSPPELLAAEEPEDAVAAAAPAADADAEFAPPAEPIALLSPRAEELLRLPAAAPAVPADAVEDEWVRGVTSRMLRSNASLAAAPVV
eukprot:comp14718_c0_seq1/m.21473 comp14718_c0_seq1/g.21473  ORF comp14718_c0_seq1/g.21473 comp14718_c0_seq1/m.21473 type:complete len:375 (-) comp14718_c0_seq1:198-1322(-)